jgi:hypothetical protein
MFIRLSLLLFLLTSSHLLAKDKNKDDKATKEKDQKICRKEIKAVCGEMRVEACDSKKLQRLENKSCYNVYIADHKQFVKRKTQECYGKMKAICPNQGELASCLKEKEHKLPAYCKKLSVRKFKQYRRKFSHSVCLKKIMASCKFDSGKGPEGVDAGIKAYQECTQKAAMRIQKECKAEYDRNKANWSTTTFD